jgi:PAS domain S-box-containing protein
MMADPDTPRAQRSPEEGVDQDYADAILRTMRQPLVVLDGSWSVVAANPAFYTTFRVGAADTLGRKVHDLGKGQWDIPALRDLLEDVLPLNGEVVDHRVTHVFETIGERVLLLNARRMRQEGQDLIILAIDDITERERTQGELAGLREFAEKIVDASRDCVLILGWDLRVKSANEKFYKCFKIDRTATEGRLIYDLCDRQWDIPKLHDLLETVLTEDGAFNDSVVEHEFEDFGKRTMILNARRIDHIELILLAIEDVTEARRAAGAMHETAMREGFLLTLSDGLRAARTAEEMTGHALGMLREHLDVDRTCFANVRRAELAADIIAECSVAELPSLPPTLALADFPVASRRATEGVVVVPDLHADADLSALDRHSLERIGLTSFIAVPLHRGEGAVTGALVAAARQPRQWTEPEIALVTETAERKRRATNGMARFSKRSTRASASSRYKSVGHGWITGSSRRTPPFICRRDFPKAYLANGCARWHLTWRSTGTKPMAGWR